MFTQSHSCTDADDLDDFGVPCLSKMELMATSYQISDFGGEPAFNIVVDGADGYSRFAAERRELEA